MTRSTAISSLMSRRIHTRALSTRMLAFSAKAGPRTPLDQPRHPRSRAQPGRFAYLYSGKPSGPAIFSLSDPTTIISAGMEIHASQRRFSCELCRKKKVKCQRIQLDDPKCVRCTVANVPCNPGQQRIVGRPKRKELASFSAVDDSPTRKRAKQTTETESLSTGSNGSRGHETLASHRSASSNIQQRFPRTETEEDRVSQWHYGDQSMASTSILSTPDPGSLQWPSFVTDLWSNNMLLQAASGNASTISALNTECVQPSAPAPGRQVDTGSSLNHRVKKRKDLLAFGIGRQPTYYVHENKFSSDPEDIVHRDVGADGSNAMAILINIVYGLRLRSTMVQSNRTRLRLELLIHREGPLFMGSYSLAEFVLTSAQELVKIVGVLVGNPSTSQKPNDQLSACLVETILDIYGRLLSFFQLFLEHLTDRAERMRTQPVIPIRGLSYNNTMITGPCTQGTLFTSTVFHLLGKLEMLLEVDARYGTGLLSASQINMLYDRLDRSNDLNHIKGIMRPKDIRNLYRQLSTILEQIAANE